jgi:hypothetical protein
MSSASLFEQLTSSVSLSMLTIVSAVILSLILLTTLAFRVFSKSKKSKSKSNSTSKQGSNKDKKTKEANPKKQQQQQQQTETTSSNKKKNNNKTKKNANATPPPPPVKPSSSSTSTSTSQSEESEDEKAALTASKKKPSTGKKVVTSDETNKSTNATKTTTKQQQVSAPVENANAVQSADGKKKQVKTNAAPAVNKQTTTAAGKNDAAANKVNKNTSNKKQPVAINSEVQQAPVDIEGGSDQEDEGQWVTQVSKQVNNRKNKGKNETSNTNNQESPSAPSSSNRKNASEKRSAVAATSTNNVSSSNNKTEVDVEPPVTSNLPTPPSTAQIQEPIEICQLLPTSENRYTANDNWWKQALNKQQTFSVDDIGEWPERDQDEQYTVQKRIIPVKTTKALTEKDINVDGNDEINNYKNGQDDEVKHNQTNSSSVVAGETKTTTTTTASQSKKKSTNVRRLS